MNAFYVITKNEIGMNISRSKKDVLPAGDGGEGGGRLPCKKVTGRGRNFNKNL